MSVEAAICRTNGLGATDAGGRLRGLEGTDMKFVGTKAAAFVDVERSIVDGVTDERSGGRRAEGKEPGGEERVGEEPGGEEVGEAGVEAIDAVGTGAAYAEVDAVGARPVSGSVELIPCWEKKLVKLSTIVDNHNLDVFVSKKIYK